MPRMIRRSLISPLPTMMMGDRMLVLTMMMIRYGIVIVDDFPGFRGNDVVSVLHLINFEFVRKSVFPSHFQLLMRRM
jgi:hypothetical protein